MKKSTLLIKSALYLIVCELAGFVITMFFPWSYQSLGMVMCFVFGICSLGAALCIYADFCLKAGGKMNTRSMRDLGQKPNDKHFGAIIGAVPAGINYIYVILLYLSKFGVIKADLFPLYKTLTFYFMPLTYIFAPNHLEYNAEGVSMSVNVPASELSVWLLLLVTLLPLLFILTCWAAYYVGFEHVDLKEKILYGGQNRS